MRISDWSSDVCSSDLAPNRAGERQIGLFVEAAGTVDHLDPRQAGKGGEHRGELARRRCGDVARHPHRPRIDHRERTDARPGVAERRERRRGGIAPRSEEHTSELQSLMRISYAVSCLKTKTHKTELSHRQK